MHVSYFIHSPLDGNLDYFQLEQMTNFAVIKTLLHAFWYTQPFSAALLLVRGTGTPKPGRYPASEALFLKLIY